MFWGKTEHLALSCPCVGFDDFPLTPHRGAHRLSGDSIPGQGHDPRHREAIPRGWHHFPSPGSCCLSPGSCCVSPGSLPRPCPDQLPSPGSHSTLTGIVLQSRGTHPRCFARRILACEHIPRLVAAPGRGCGASLTPGSRQSIDYLRVCTKTGAGTLVLPHFGSMARQNCVEYVRGSRGPGQVVNIHRGKEFSAVPGDLITGKEPISGPKHREVALLRTETPGRSLAPDRTPGRSLAAIRNTGKKPSCDPKHRERALLQPKTPGSDFSV